MTPAMLVVMTVAATTAFSVALAPAASGIVAPLNDVSMVTYAFVPPVTGVLSGGTVTFTNTGMNFLGPYHDVLAPGHFRSSVLGPGDSETITISAAPGTVIPYVCTFHTGMTGQIVVA